MTFTRESIVANQTFTYNPASVWNKSTPSYNNWLSNGTHAYPNDQTNQYGYQYLAATTTYPYGTLAATFTLKLNTGLVIGGQDHAGVPTKGVYFGVQEDAVTGVPMIFLQVMGVSTMAQQSYGYGLRSEIVAGSLLNQTIQVRFTLAYGQAWVEYAANNRLIIRLTFGNMLSADVRDSIESTSCRMGYWQDVTVASPAVFALTATQANSRRQLNVATDDGGYGTAVTGSFTTNQDPWNPASTHAVYSPWTAVSPPAAGKLYVSGSQLMIATDSASGERYSAFYSGSSMTRNLQDLHYFIQWQNGSASGGYSMGFQGASTMRLAIWSDPVNGSVFGNYYRPA